MRIFRGNKVVPLKVGTVNLTFMPMVMILLLLQILLLEVLKLWMSINLFGDNSEKQMFGTMRLKVAS